MLNDIYTRQILSLAANIPHLGRLPRADATAMTHSKLCGSVITVDLVIEDGKVREFAHEVQACALGQASAAVMGRLVLGATVEELFAVRKAMRCMLKEGSVPPVGRWEALAVFEPIRDYPARHGSVLLTFDAVIAAFASIGVFPMDANAVVD